MRKEERMDIEITSWKVRAYDFYSRVEKYRKTNEWVFWYASTSEQKLYKALSMKFFVYFIGTEIYLRIFVRRKLGFEGPQSSGTPTIKFH